MARVDGGRRQAPCADKGVSPENSGGGALGVEIHDLASNFLDVGDPKSPTVTWETELFERVWALVRMKTSPLLSHRSR